MLNLTFVQQAGLKKAKQKLHNFCLQKWSGVKNVITLSHILKATCDAGLGWDWDSSLAPDTKILGHGDTLGIMMAAASAGLFSRNNLTQLNQLHSSESERKFQSCYKGFLDLQQDK